MRRIFKSNSSFGLYSMNGFFCSLLVILFCLDWDGIASPSAVFVSSSCAYHRVTFDRLYSSNGDVAVGVLYLVE